MEFLSGLDKLNREFAVPLIIGFLLGLIGAGVIWMRYNFTLRIGSRLIHSPPIHTCEYCEVGD